MSSEEAQELHGFGTKPAADLEADNNKPAAPRAVELRVCLMSLASGCGRHSGTWLDVCAWVGLGAPCERAHESHSHTVIQSYSTHTVLIQSYSHIVM